MRTHKAVLKLTKRIRRLFAAEAGIAAVEFALLVPVMLVLYLGAVDITQGLSADRKLAQSVSTISDLVARHKNQVSIGELNAYFDAANAIMRPFEGSDTKLRLSIVKVSNGRTATIEDTEIYNGADQLNKNDVFENLSEEMIELARGRFVVVAEGWYQYSPLIGYVFQSDIPLYKRSIHLLRFDSDSFEIADNGAGNSNAPALPPDSGGNNCAGNSQPGNGNNCSNPNNSHNDNRSGRGRDRDRDCRGRWC